MSLMELASTSTADSGNSFPYQTNQLSEELLASVKKQIKEEPPAQEYEDQDQEMQYEEGMGMDYTEVPMQSEGDIENLESNGSFCGSASADSPGSSGILSDEFEINPLLDAEPVPVIFPSESINALLGTQELSDANPKIAECLGQAALQQLRQIILVASQVSFHNKAAGMRLSDFAFAETQLNNSTKKIVHSSSVYEEPPYELSSNGMLVPGEGPPIAPEKHLKARKESRQILEQLKDPLTRMISVQRINFHGYQNQESEDVEGSDSSRESGESEESDENEHQDRELTATQNEVIESNKDNEEDESTFENTSTDENDETNEVAVSENDSEDTQDTAAIGEEAQIDKALKTEVETEDALDQSKESDEENLIETDYLRNGSEVSERVGDEFEEAQSPVSLNEYVENVDRDMLLSMDEYSVYVADKLLDPDTEQDSSGNEVTDNEIEENLDEFDGAVNVNDENGNEIPQEDYKTVMENISDIINENEIDAQDTQEQEEDGADRTAVNSCESQENIEAECNEGEEEQVLSTNEYDDNVEMDQPNEIDSENSSNENPSSSSAEESSSGSGSDDEKYDEMSLPPEWVEYMKVLMEEFIALDDDEQPFLEGLHDAVDHEGSEFSKFVEDVADHGCLPLISVWCDFCQDFLSLKYYPTVSRTHIHGMLSLFKAILKNRVSQCITPFQMEQILAVLIELTHFSPPWDTHEHLASIFSLVLKKAKDDHLLDVISLTCSFVTETLKWFVTSSSSWAECDWEDWDHTCKVFSISLRVVNVLEQHGLHFMEEFNWYKYLAIAIHACQNATSLRQLAVDKKLLVANFQQARSEECTSSEKLDVLELEHRENYASQHQVAVTAGSAGTAGSTTRASTTIPAQDDSTSQEMLKTEQEVEDGEDNQQFVQTMIKSLGDAAVARAWKKQFRDMLKLRSASRNLNSVDHNEPNTQAQARHSTTQCSSDEPDNVLLHGESVQIIRDVVGLLADRTLADQLEMKVRESSREAAPQTTDSTSKNHNCSTESSALVGKENLRSINLPIIANRSVHEQMENVMLLLFKNFLRKYSSIVPASELAQIQKMATSYFGDRINQVASSQILESPKVKRRKLDKKAITTHDLYLPQ